MYVVSNCNDVCPLPTPQPGGEVYFSDVYSNQAIPEVLRKNKVLWGELIWSPDLTSPIN